MIPITDPSSADLRAQQSHSRLAFYATASEFIALFRDDLKKHTM